MNRREELANWLESLCDCKEFHGGGYSNEPLLQPESQADIREAAALLRQSCDIPTFTDYPTAFAIINQTKADQHHEKCSFRQTDGGCLCDCAAVGVIKLTFDFLRKPEPPSHV